MATTNSQSSPRQSTERTYGQYCPIAAGLDLIGDRWTLLILRELSMGDQRFTDLRGELTGIAPNLLTERLRSLQAIGLVTTAELPPPAARSVYRLTEEGRRIEPVLRSVARFGISYLTGDPSDVFDASARGVLATGAVATTARDQAARPADRRQRHHRASTG